MAQWHLTELHWSPLSPACLTSFVILLIIVEITHQSAKPEREKLRQKMRARASRFFPWVFMFAADVIL
jgi:hypothetical protein